ncbi:hypothetical protein KAI11_01350 [Candidatus Bathyarchaeota archaeon]|nr:hypothetical protein [Candidatus Bathyarchaeota archaeon]
MTRKRFFNHPGFVRFLWRPVLIQTSIYGNQKAIEQSLLLSLDHKQRNVFTSINDEPSYVSINGINSVDWKINDIMNNCDTYS